MRNSAWFLLALMALIVMAAGYTFIKYETKINFNKFVKDRANRQCKTDADCVLRTHPCVAYGWVTINRSKEPLFDLIINDKNNAIICANNYAVKPRVECFNGVCRFKPDINGCNLKLEFASPERPCAVNCTEESSDQC